ncbi:DoxX family protein [Dyadobacter luticola]|uniref:DoxX family protein n=1 Tax=Dyadobacter luticola TaxID=1979387 RepID=A0A5R9KTF8_9BACT|nr:DoxX family protein [Dyadobacter luticola]TLU99419.1 DoxX family protein [Dyadobacter luticola]
MKEIGMYVMALTYLTAGIMHFVRPGVFVKIVPHNLPSPLLLVYLSGICEMIFSLMLVIPQTRHLGAWLIILLLIAVFPANIQMAMDFYHQKNPYLWVSILRLPLQFVLIGWAWLYTR